MNLKAKRFIILIITSVLVAVLMLYSEQKVFYKEGVYEGRGEGHHGEIRIELITDKYRIKEIRVLEHHEMPQLFEIVNNKIPKKVIRINSPDVEGIAGASYTSDGLLHAIREAVDKARIDKR